ncbi:MAG: hypothetical protein ACI35P_06260 [Bacillus sp. (in: firmicutes)]
MPRTQEVGKVQEQLQQRSQISNDFAVKEMQKEVKKLEKTVVRQRQKGKVDLKQEEKLSEHLQQMKYEKKEQEELSKTKHPYKGSTIDYSG